MTNAHHLGAPDDSMDRTQRAFESLEFAVEHSARAAEWRAKSGVDE